MSCVPCRPHLGHGLRSSAAASPTASPIGACHCRKGNGPHPAPPPAAGNTTCAAPEYWVSRSANELAKASPNAAAARHWHQANGAWNSWFLPTPDGDSLHRAGRRVSAGPRTCRSQEWWTPDSGIRPDAVSSRFRQQDRSSGWSCPIPAAAVRSRTGRRPNAALSPSLRPHDSNPAIGTPRDAAQSYFRCRIPPSCRSDDPIPSGTARTP